MICGVVTSISGRGVCTACRVVCDSVSSAAVNWRLMGHLEAKNNQGAQSAKESAYYDNSKVKILHFNLIHVQSYKICTRGRQPVHKYLETFLKLKSL
jgi:hypothetical protein